MAIDLIKIRSDFPILSRTIYNSPLVYFDNAATTQKPKQVIEKMNQVYFELNSNIHRGVHYLSQQSTIAHEESREEVRKYINAQKQEEIIFTRGTTESINLVASSFCAKFCKQGDEIIISGMEHHSNIVPWQMAAERFGLILRIIPFDKDGVLDIEAYKKLLNEKTRLVSVVHVANTMGTVNPVDQIIALAHQNNSYTLIDAAQSIAHFKIDVQKMDCDFLVFSAHKLYGPTGMGVLYGKEALLEAIPPYHGGGEMVDRVTFEKTTYNCLPFKFEAGTPDYVGSVGMAEAMRYVNNIGLDDIKLHEDNLLQYATKRIMEIDEVRIFGNSPHKSGVLSFLVGEIHPFDLGTLLDQLGIAVRTGHHCAQPVMDFFGIEGTVRASFAFYNTTDEIDTFITALKRVVIML